MLEVEHVGKEYAIGAVQESYGGPQAYQEFVAQGGGRRRIGGRENTTIAAQTIMDAAALKQLIQRERVAALGTLREGAPLVSMTLYLAADDFSRGSPSFTGGLDRRTPERS